MRIVIVAAAMILAASAPQAEARGRVKFRSVDSVLPIQASTVPVTAKAERGGMPVAVVGASMSGRSTRASTHDEMTTGSTAPSSTLAPLVAGSAARATAGSTKPSKPAFVCARDRTFGAGSGFCEVN